MNAKTKILLKLIGLGIVDVVIPVPILAIILITVVLQRPAWLRIWCATSTAHCKAGSCGWLKPLRVVCREQV